MEVAQQTGPAADREEGDAQVRFTLYLPKGDAPVIWATDGKNAALVQDVSPDRALRITLKRQR